MDSFKISEHVYRRFMQARSKDLVKCTLYDYSGMRMRVQLNDRLRAFKSGHAEMCRCGNHSAYVYQRDTCMTAQFWA